MGETAFLVLLLCGSQDFQGSACNAATAAYFTSINGQQTLDTAAKEWLEPVPYEIRQVGTVAYTLITRCARVTVSKHVYLDLGADTNMLTFEWKL